MFGDEEVQRAEEAERFMGSAGVIESEEICKASIEDGSEANDIDMIVDKFFLDGSIIAFDKGVDLWAVWIREEMRDAILFQGFIKFTQIFRAVVSLPTFDFQRLKLVLFRSDGRRHLPIVELKKAA